MVEAGAIDLSWFAELATPFAADSPVDDLKRACAAADVCAAARPKVLPLLDVDFRQPSIDDENLLKLVHWTTLHAGEQDEMFRRMMFNALAHNRGDHLKNHAF